MVSRTGRKVLAAQYFLALIFIGTLVNLGGKLVTLLIVIQTRGMHILAMTPLRQWGIVREQIGMIKMAIIF